jgi:poly(A) polymerase
MSAILAEGPPGRQRPSQTALDRPAPPVYTPTMPPDGEALRAAARGVALRLRAAGHTAYFAGGCVRDRLLGKEPQDYDVATSARPEEVRALFGEERTVAVGAQFGVILVVTDTAPFEVATFRRDDAYVDGRRPSAVYFGNPKDDAERRDFTINGLFEDPESGEVIDFVGGRADLERRTIRAIGEPRARFEEDKLRLLRGVRFVAQLGFEIEPRTLAAIGALAPEIQVVAAERVLVELGKTITPKGRVRGLELLHETGLLREILPEVAALEGVAQPPEFHPEGDCWRHQLLVMANLPDPCPEELAWGALLHDIGKPPTFVQAERIRFDGHAQVGAEMADAVMRRLRASARLRETVVELVADHLRFADVPRMKESTLKRFLRRDAVDLHLALHRADCLGCHGILETYDFCVQKLAEFRAAGAADALRPAPILRGDDLIAAGYRPGPAFKEILAAVEDAQLEGRIAGKEDALAFVRERFPRS